MNMTTGEIPAANSINMANEQVMHDHRMPLWQRVGAGATAILAVNSISMIQDFATAEPAAAVVSSHDAWFPNPADEISHALGHIRTDKKPNFTEIAACTKPLETTPTQDVRTLAEFCVKYGFGTTGKSAKVAILDFTKKSPKSLRSAGNQMESLLFKATDGDMKLHTTVLQPSKKAKAAVRALAATNSGGCIKSTVKDGSVANEARKVMPKLKYFPLVIAVTDYNECGFGGVSDEKSSVDVYGAKRLSTSALAGVEGHELGHTLLKQYHAGVVAPPDSPFYEATDMIPSNYLANGELDVEQYQEAGEYRQYDPNCSNIMGTACGKEHYVYGRPKPTLSPFQKDGYMWALNAVGKGRDVGLREVGDKDVTMLANVAQTGSMGIITLDGNISAGQQNGVDNRGYGIEFDRALVSPVREIIKGTNIYQSIGFQFELANSKTITTASFGRIALEVGESMSILLPGSTSKTIVVTRGAKDSITMRTGVNEKISEGDW